MNQIFLILSFIVLVSACTIESPTISNNIVQYDKYNIEKDTNWVLFTDTNEINSDFFKLCSSLEIGIFLNSQSEYKLLWDSIRKKDSISLGKFYKSENFKPIDCNFEHYSIIGRFMADGGNAKFINRFYIRKDSSQILHLITHSYSGIKNLLCYPFFYKIPVFNKRPAVLFDTINKYGN